MAKIDVTTIALMTNKDLLSLYNKLNAPEPAIKKFKNRAEGEHLVLTLIQELGVDPTFEEEVGTLPKALRPAKVVLTPEEVQAKRIAGVKASWENPAVKAARAAHNGVQVDGVQFKSVYAAYVELGLPVAKHAAFRAKLKAAGELVDSEGRLWVVTEVPKAPKPVKAPKEAAAE